MKAGEGNLGRNSFTRLRLFSLGERHATPRSQLPGTRIPSLLGSFYFRNFGVESVMLFRGGNSRESRLRSGRHGATAVSGCYFRAFPKLAFRYQVQHQGSREVRP